MGIILKIENLKKHFPIRGSSSEGKKYKAIRAVDGIGFELQKGETLGLVGESGCGKSTTGWLILRLMDPTEGSIWFKGKEITGLTRKEMKPLRQAMQIIFQDPYSSLDPRMTVSEIIGEGLRTMNLSVQEQKERILDIMGKVGMRLEHYNRYPHEFSGGQRQRISIARAIILNPELVVADEPISALDVSIQAQIINLLEKLKEEFEFSCLFISHELNVVEHISDRIAVMYLGKIVELAPSTELYENPKHPYTMALLSAIPVPNIRHNKQRIILKGDVPNAIDLPQGCRFHARCNQNMGICSQSEPQLNEVGEAHFVACNLY